MFSIEFSIKSTIENPDESESTHFKNLNFSGYKNDYFANQQDEWRYILRNIAGIDSNINLENTTFSLQNQIEDTEKFISKKIISNSYILNKYSEEYCPSQRENLFF